MKPHLPACVSLPLALSALAPAALAAGEPPDPFADYQASHPESAPVEVVTPPARPGTGGADADEPAALPWKQGSWQIGGFGTFEYAGSNSDLLNGGEESNRNLFLRIAPRFGYFILDRVELGGSLGILTKSLNREGKSLSSETDFMLEATISYAVPVTSRFALVPGAGLGFYLGSSSRPVNLNGTETDEDTSSRGIAFSIYPMLAYQLTPDWQIRSGVAMTMLYGSELIKSADERLGTSAAYFGIPIQISYTFH
ncbi:MAG: hypothetical protein OZ921_18965 [Sorangiineae bacterium]|nr:hypothetical protein [Polyangiaceae bacterium]MEB2324605.1 hypothetical protein [Sorangiineae bacterium]